MSIRGENVNFSVAIWNKWITVLVDIIFTNKDHVYDLFCPLVCLSIYKRIYVKFHVEVLWLCIFFLLLFFNSMLFVTFILRMISNIFLLLFYVIVHIFFTPAIHIPAQYRVWLVEHPNVPRPSEVSTGAWNRPPLSLKNK